MKKGKFLIITANRFPTGDAGAVRLRAFASLLKELGYVPIVIGMGDATRFSKKTYEWIEYYSLRYSSRHIFFRILGRILYSRNLKKIVNSIEEPVNGILIDSCDRSTLSFVKKLSKRNGIKPIYDSVEWYSECEFKNGAKNHAYRWNNALNTRLIDDSFNIIAISTYLEDHFSNRKITTTRIPVIMDVHSMVAMSESNRENSNLKIVYAGSMGKKDHIQEMLDGLALLSNEERERVRFSIIGITREQYEQYYGVVSDATMESATFMGRVSRDEVLENLSTADFSFLLRPSNERYAKAGFPTKVVEALATGIPMMCNYSSDLKMYLRDGENAVIIDDCSAESCAKAIRKALTFTLEELSSLRKNARKTAEENFDWRLYQESFDHFLK